MRAQVEGLDVGRVLGVGLAGGVDARPLDERKLWKNGRMQMLEREGQLVRGAQLRHFRGVVRGADMPLIAGISNLKRDFPVRFEIQIDGPN